MLLLCFGMWRFAVLWQAEHEQLSVIPSSESVQTPERVHDLDTNADLALDEGSVLPALTPETYVHGVVINNQAKAYVSSNLYDGLTDIVANERLFVTKIDERVRFFTLSTAENAAPVELTNVESEWSAWQAMHQDTLIWFGE